MINFFSKKSIFTILIILIIPLIYSLAIAKNITNELVLEYQNLESNIIYDRNNEIIQIQPNKYNNYAIYQNNISQEFKNYLIKKEDKFFYYHFGINPFSIIRALKDKYLFDKKITSSTITQQLVKILLKNESKRTLKNKLKESFYAFSLELFLSKEEILKMYYNSFFLGNNVSGLKMANKLYFNKDNLELSNYIQLLASISNPSYANPFKSENITISEKIATKLNLNDFKFKRIPPNKSYLLKDKFHKYTTPNINFEIKDFVINEKTNKLTLDKNLSDQVRQITQNAFTDYFYDKNAKNAAVIILKQPENELLTIIGSVNPKENNHGNKINMALKPRTIGSTFKPFIYLEGFKKNLRPYTLVEDKEYKYLINNNFAFYPKNYDYKYHGLVNLHYSLSNSLNVGAVKVLEYNKIDSFNDFITQTLGYKTPQDINNYQLGIALGGLEMDLLHLTYYFSIFNNNGHLKPLQISQTNSKTILQSDKILNSLNLNRKISDDEYIQLINKILSDRHTSVDQFTQKSYLNLPIKNYALKTGTSRNYHDSLIVGYTPNFSVGVWVGNIDEKPMDELSGSLGAGYLWQKIMTLLINSKYYTDIDFSDDNIKEYNLNNNIIEYGLIKDNYEFSKNLLLDDYLIVTPHNNDSFELQKNNKIILKAKFKVDWFINGTFVSNNNEYIWEPIKKGQYIIKANSNSKQEQIKIFLE